LSKKRKGPKTYTMEKDNSRKQKKGIGRTSDRGRQEGPGPGNGKRPFVKGSSPRRGSGHSISCRRARQRRRKIRKSVGEKEDSVSGGEPSKESSEKDKKRGRKSTKLKISKGKMQADHHTEGT